VAIISGSSKVGQLIDKEIRATYAAHADKYDFIYLGHLAKEDILDRLAKLPDYTIVIYHILMLDGNREGFKPWKVASMISETANSPTYSIEQPYWISLTDNKMGLVVKGLSARHAYSKAFKVKNCVSQSCFRG